LRGASAYLALRQACIALLQARWMDAWVYFWCSVGIALCDVLLAVGPILFFLLIAWLAGVFE
jgi:hypothetical protein